MQGARPQGYCRISRLRNAVWNKLDKQKCASYSAAIPKDLMRVTTLDIQKYNVEVKLQWQLKSD